MNALEFAALGCRRGAGESLSSWLRAGPLGSNAVASLESPTTMQGQLREGDLYCPACRLEESGRRRWYSRIEWQTPYAVICSTHAIPLLSCETPPIRLRGTRWSKDLRSEFRALSDWIVTWVETTFTRPIRCISTPEQAVVQAILCRLDPRTPYSAAFAEAQWQLWANGWPVTHGPVHLTGCRALPLRQSDRLALMAIAHRVCIDLRLGLRASMPLLPVRPRTLALLRAHLRKLQPAWSEQVPKLFVSDFKAGNRRGANAN